MKKEIQEMTTDNKKILPEKINVMRVVTYDVDKVIDSLIEENDGVPADAFDLQAVLDRLMNWVEEDFDGETSDLIYQDEDGNNLQ